MVSRPLNLRKESRLGVRGLYDRFVGQERWPSNNSVVNVSLSLCLFVDSVRNTLFLNCEVICTGWRYRARQKWQRGTEAEPAVNPAGGEAGECGFLVICW